MKKEQESNVIWSCEKNARQERFLSCPADEVLYGGCAGPGKSEGLLMSAFGDSDQNVINNGNWKALILRRTFPDLERTLIQRSIQIFGQLGAKYDGQKYRWTFPSGGLIQFGHMKTEYDKYNYKSAEYNVICFDEVTEFTETMYLYLFSRCRTTDPSLRPKMRAASNPTGIGHAWVKRRFIDREDGSRIEPDVVHRYEVELPNGEKKQITRCFIPAKLSDNSFIYENDKNYVARLMELPEMERRALMDGDWDIFSGQFFPEFNEEHICEPFSFPLGWPVWISLDYGFATKTAIGFYTQDILSGTYYLFDEIYCSKKNANELSGMIKEKLGRRFIDLVGRYGDKRIFIKDEELGISTQQKFALNGIYFQMSNDDRVEGWRRCREMLSKEINNRVINFKVFSSCKNFIEMLPNCQFDINNPEDMNKRGENHHADQFRYFSIMRKHTDKETYLSKENEYELSPTTGYAGMRDDYSAPLRNSIRRLPNLKLGHNYLFRGGWTRGNELS